MQLNRQVLAATFDLCLLICAVSRCSSESEHSGNDTFIVRHLDSNSSDISISDYNTESLTVENQDEHSESNASEPETISTTPAPILPRFNCTPIDRNQSLGLILVNSTTISNYLQLKSVSTLDLPAGGGPSTNQSSNQEPGPCILLIFYLNWCPFSAAAAPHINALGRLFPQFYILAIDAYNLYSITMRFGVVGVPSMYMFHNGKLVSRFNKTEANITNFSRYLHEMTLLEPIDEPVLIEEDHIGPLVIDDQPGPNYLFILSWLFCIVVAIYYFSRSDFFHRIKEHVRNMWNEAQFHHDHID